MKIKNCIVFTSLIFMMILSTAFVTPTQPTLEIKAEGVQSFAEFLSHFEKTNLPFELQLDDLKEYNKVPKKIKKMPRKKGRKSPLAATTFLPEIDLGYFSRMGPPEVKAIARFYPSDKTVAVIYSLKKRFGNQFNKSYQMMIFDLHGNPVTGTKKGINEGRSFQIASTSARETITCRIDGNGQIWKNTYENVWEKNVREAGVNDNKMLGFKIKDTVVYNWNENGAIAKMKEIPTSDRASR